MPANPNNDYAKGLAASAIKADEVNPSAVSGASAEKRLRKIAGMPKKKTAAKASGAAAAKAKAKGQAKKKERMEYKAPTTTDEMRKRRAKKARNASPAKPLLDAKDKAGKQVSKIQGLLKAFGFK